MAANKLMRWLRRGYDQGVKLTKKYPVPYVAEISVKLGDTPIAKWEMELQAKDEKHAKLIATAYVRDHVKIGYKINRSKQGRKHGRMKVAK